MTPDRPISRLHRLEVGESGTPVVFLHGLFGQGRNWTQIAKGLADEHRVRMFDLPDHGRSPWSERFDYLAMADAVAVELAPEPSASAEPVTLVGHSMGGKVAMLVALRHPELVARLCVVDVSPTNYGLGREFEGYIAAMKALDTSAIERRADADEALKAAVPSEMVRGFLLQNLRQTDNSTGAGWRWQINLDLLGRDLGEVAGWPELTGVTAYDGPVLWVAGGKSDYIRGEHVQAMEQLFPHLRRVTVKNAGHWVHAEQPAVVIELLRRFAGS